MNKRFLLASLVAVLLAVFFLDSSAMRFGAPMVFAHCDTMNGPVIKDAKKALESGDVNIVLKWVQKKDEAEITALFQKTVVVRKLNPQAKEIADAHFFETLVRIHRAGEGVPYTGIKPESEGVEPGIAAADTAVESGNADKVINKLASNMSKEIYKRFKHVMEKKKHASNSVEAGREYVEAYVGFIHYVEGLHMAISKEDGHHGAKTEEVHEH